jgi:hypothetical protein
VTEVAMGLSTTIGTGGIRPVARRRCSSTSSDCVRPTANAGMSTVPPRATVRRTTSAIASAGVDRGVHAVAVGRLQHDHVGGRPGLGRLHDHVLVAPEVPGEQDRAPGGLDGDAGGAEDVAGAGEPRVPSSGQVEAIAELDGRQQLEREVRVLDRVQRQRRVVAREPVAVGVAGVELLQGQRRP